MNSPPDNDPLSSLNVKEPSPILSHTYLMATSYLNLRQSIMDIPGLRQYTL